MKNCMAHLRFHFCPVCLDDWSRVRLNTPNPAMVSDYINASYMPVGITS